MARVQDRVMARRLRFVPPGSLVEVTCRTLQGRLLLRPSPILRDLTLGVLARAARLYPVDVHAFAFLSNHYHLLITVRDAQRLAAFMNYLNSNLAREAGRLVRWREKFWGRRYQAICVSNEEVVQVARLGYILSQGVKEGLVATPVDWPGAHCASALLEGRRVTGHWIDRTLEYAARRRGVVLPAAATSSSESLLLTPLPCWSTRDADWVRERVRELVCGIEAEGVARQSETGKAPLGHDFLYRQNPYFEPNRLKRGPAPLVHAISRSARDALIEAYRLFHAAYRRAAESLRGGEVDARFPEGSFPPALPFQPAPTGH